ncbi:MAG: NDP-sugar synthase [Elusimicrobiales bacterium]
MMADKFAGIFAAGEGSRLQAAFPGTPKPMVPVRGAPLIEWTVRLLRQAGIENATILLNSKGRSAKEHLKKTFPDMKFVFIIKDTKSSYESFRLVAQTLAEETDKFMMSAVDSLYNPADLAEFINYAGRTEFDAALGITDRIADEKPLWADINEKGRITALGEKAKRKIYATNGLYCLAANIAREMPEPARYGALRQYLGELVSGGKTVMSALIPQSVDVDDETDIKLAEDFITRQLEKTP